MEKGESMTRGTKRWRLGALTAAVTIVMGVIGAGVGGAARSGADSASATTLIDGTTGTVVNIDPANEYDYDSFTVDLPIYQGLYGFPSGAKVKPVLATGCSHTKNLKTWTCHLRHGVKFSNGDSMTSADVKYSFDRVQKIKGDQGIWTLLTYLKSTTTNGPYTVVFHLTSPDSIWPYILSTN